MRNLHLTISQGRNGALCHFMQKRLENWPLLLQALHVLLALLPLLPNHGRTAVQRARLASCGLVPHSAACMK